MPEVSRCPRERRRLSTHPPRGPRHRHPPDANHCRCRGQPGALAEEGTGGDGAGSSAADGPSHRSKAAASRGRGPHEQPSEGTPCAPEAASRCARAGAHTPGCAVGRDERVSSSHACPSVPCAACGRPPGAVKHPLLPPTRGDTRGHPPASLLRRYHGIFGT